MTLQAYTPKTRSIQPTIVLQSVLTCPHCGAQEELTMPTHVCQFFHVCSSCGVRLKSKTGDCCVFCSYGSLPCPPIQHQAMSGTQAEYCQ